MNAFINPVDLAITAFGGVRVMARAINRDPSAVTRWRQAGHIPANMQRIVLSQAWERGLDLTAHDIVFGRKFGND